MRLNQRLIAKGIKRQPGDFERELVALARQQTFFTKIRRAANIIAEAFRNLLKTIGNILQPIFNAIGDILVVVEDEECRQTVTEQLPELPKLQRFRSDLL